MDDRDLREERFRLYRFTQKVRRLEDAAIGGDAELLPFISDVIGEFDPGKTDAFVRRLIQGLDEFDRLEEGLEAFYTSVLYCAVRALTTPYTLYEAGNAMNLCGAAEQASFISLLELLRWEVFEDAAGLVLRPVDAALAGVMDAIYRALSGGPLPGADVLQGAVLPLPDSLTREEIDEVLARAAQQEEAELSPEEAEQKRTWDEAQAEENLRMRQAEDRRLKRVFLNPDDYRAHYENMVRLFATCYQRDRFVRNIRAMVRRFLLEEGCGVYRDEDAYVTMRVQLQRVERAVQTRLRSNRDARGGGKS